MAAEGEVVSSGWTEVPPSFVYFQQNRESTASAPLINFFKIILKKRNYPDREAGYQILLPPPNLDLAFHPKLVHFWTGQFQVESG